MGTTLNAFICVHSKKNIKNLQEREAKIIKSARKMTLKKAIFINKRPCGVLKRAATKKAECGRAAGSALT